MEKHEEEVAQLSEQLRERREELNCARKDEERSIEALRSLLDRVEAQPEAFDVEDVAKIRARLEDRCARLADLNWEIAEHEAGRGERELIFGAHRRSLELRTAVLEAEDARTGVLTAHNDLLVFFARKHLTLQKLLEEKMRQSLAAGAATRHAVANHSHARVARNPGGKSAIISLAPVASGR